MPITLEAGVDPPHELVAVTASVTCEVPAVKVTFVPVVPDVGDVDGPRVGEIVGADCRDELSLLMVIGPGVFVGEDELLEFPGPLLDLPEALRVIVGERQRFPPGRAGASCSSGPAGAGGVGGEASARAERGEERARRRGRV